MRALFTPTLARYLVREFLKTFALTLLAFVAIFLIADFFDRFDDFLRHDADPATIARAFAYKVPVVLVQVTPVAVLSAALIALGLLARHHEFVALRSCGVSLWQITTPLALCAALIGGAVFLWGETVVPTSARRWRQIWNVEVKQRQPLGLFVGRDVWFHGKAGFYNIDRVAGRRRTLYGLTVYQIRREDDFRPWRVVQIGEAEWRDRRWDLRNVRTIRTQGETLVTEQGAPANFTIPETLDDFRVVVLEPEEVSYEMLRRQIRNLIAKGADVRESWVDLHLKIATPAASLIMMLIAIPFAARGTRATSLPAAFGLGFALGASYFFVVAVARALGQAQTLPPVVAAWTANGIFALVAGYNLLAND